MSLILNIVAGNKSVKAEIFQKINKLWINNFFFKNIYDDTSCCPLLYFKGIKLMEIRDNSIILLKRVV